MAEAEIELYDQDIRHVVGQLDISVRLRNVLSNPKFPFATLREALKSTDPAGEIRRLQNAGRKTAYEFEELINNFNISNFLPAEIDPLEVEKDNLFASVLAVLNNFPFPSCLLASNLPISVRLSNILKELPEQNQFSSLGVCLESSTELFINALRWRGSGRKSLRELQDLILLSINRIMKDLESSEFIVAFCRSKFIKDSDIEWQDPAAAIKQLNDLGLNLQIKSQYLIPYEKQIDKCTEADLIQVINNELDERLLGVLSARYGFADENCETLQQIADRSGITRERIRQLEKKSLEILRRKGRQYFEAFLLVNAERINNTLWQNEKFVFDSNLSKRFSYIGHCDKICIDILYGSLRGYLDQCGIREGEYWIAGSLDEKSVEDIREAIKQNQKFSSIKQAIRKVISKYSFPVSLSSICMELQIYTEKNILQCLKDSFGALIVDDHIERISKGLSAEERLICCLRTAGRSLKFQEIIQFHQSFFDSPITIGIITNTLGHSEEALIVDRGKYDLYENINAQDVILKEVRDKCFNYLESIRNYVSAKVLYTHLFKSASVNIPRFNSYMLFGIIQDDRRFISRRGLMVGLTTFSQDGFTSLTDSIYELVEMYGPISAAEVQRALIGKREVLGVTISMILENSSQYVRNEQGKYDRIDKVIGSKSFVQTLKEAIEVLLLGGPRSAVDIKASLGRIGIILPSRTIISFVKKFPEFSYSDLEVYSAEISERVSSYNTYIEESILPDNHFNERTRENLREKIPASLKKLLELDERFLEKQINEISSESGLIAPLVLSGFKVEIGMKANG